MQTQVMDRPSAGPGADEPAVIEHHSHKTVVSTHGGLLVCLDLRRVVGCVQLEKLTRLPGAHERIEGVFFFRGRPVPLVSVGRESGAPRHHKRQPEEHALVVSMRGREFAVRVDAVPKILESPLPYGICADSSCVMRARHIERFLALCVLSGNEP